MDYACLSQLRLLAVKFGRSNHNTVPHHWDNIILALQMHIIKDVARPPLLGGAQPVWGGPTLCFSVFLSSNFYYSVQFPLIFHDFGGGPGPLGPNVATSMAVINMLLYK